MPDLPTSRPGTYYFPSAAPAKHSKSYFPSEPMSRLDDLGGMTEDMVPIQNVHEKWGKLSDEMVRASLRTNGKKEKQHLTTPLPPSGREDRDATQQRRGPWDSTYSNVSVATLQGGVMNTKSGRDYVAKRLKERVAEYNAMGSVAFTPEEPEAPTKKELDAASVIYQLLLDVNGMLVEGVIDQKIVDLANAVAGRLYSDGNTLSVSDVSRMLDIVYRMERDLQAIIRRGFRAVRGFEAPELAPEGAFAQLEALQAQAEAQAGEGEEVVYPEPPPPGEAMGARGVRNYLYMLDRVLKRILGILTTLNKYIFATPEDKATLLSALRPALFEKEIKARPTPAGETPLTSAATLSGQVPAPGRSAQPAVVRFQNRPASVTQGSPLALPVRGIGTAVQRTGRGMTGRGQPFFF